MLKAEGSKEIDGFDKRTASAMFIYYIMQSTGVSITQDWTAACL